MRDGQNLWQAEKEDVWKAELDTELDFGPTKEVKVFGSAEEAEDGWTHSIKSRGSDQRGEPKPKPTEKGEGNAKEAKKTKTQT